MYLLVILLPLIGSFFSGLFAFYFGQKGSAILSLSCVSISMIFSFIIAFETLYFNGVCYLYLFDWFDNGLFFNEWSFVFDSITSIMLCVVLFVSTLVHLYSTEYMAGDPHLSRFMSYLSLFTFFMLMLVTSSNLLQLFLGWEGVGLCSYLLISFWFTRLQANKAAIKAIVVNKIGDFALVIAISTCFFLFHSLDFSVIFSCIPFFLDDFFLIYIVIGHIQINFIGFIGLMLFIGAVGKSAQLLLHTWLPDAMEGPTPVSALIHAATMVTAGVFLLIRCSAIFEEAGNLLILILIMGGLTAFFAATSGMLQYDLKKVIAYSTCSQLGYMVFACGLSSYNVSLFHLANHAFFKALLFLSAGSVIHALSNEQDMRRMGGLVNLLPFSYVMFLIGSLALAGFPFLTGFYSKDVILEIAASNYTINGLFIYWLATISAFLTAFYSFRLIYLTFYGVTNSSRGVMHAAHEPGIAMTLPLICLAFGSIFLGYLNKDLVIGMGSITFGNSITIAQEHLYILDSEFLPVTVKLIPFFFSLFGIFSSLILFYMYSFYLYLARLHPVGYFFYTFLIKKWYFDSIFNYYFSTKFLVFGYKISYKLFDQGIIEFMGPTGLSRLFSTISYNLNFLTTGYIFHYAFFILIGLIFILFYWLLFFMPLVLFFDFKLLLIILVLFLNIKRRYVI